MNEWKEGYPKEQGWFRCLVDGKVMKLKHFVCQMSGRHEWADENNDYIYEDVKWSPPLLEK